MFKAIKSKGIFKQTIIYQQTYKTLLIYYKDEDNNMLLM